MDHNFGVAERRFQNVPVIQIAAKYVCSGIAKGLKRTFVATEGTDVPSAAESCSDNGPSEEARCACYRNAH
jgi:hypothetical protein